MADAAWSPGAMTNTLRAIVPVLIGAADREVRRWLAVALVVVAAGGLLAAAGPVALKAMVDALAQPGAAGTWSGRDALLLGAGYVAATCASRWLIDFGPLVTGRADQRLERHLTARFFDHVLSLPLGSLLRRPHGELLRSLDLSNAGCRVVVLQAVNGLVPALVELLVMALVLMQLDQPALLTTFTATALLYLLVYARGAHHMARCGEAVSTAHLSQHAFLADQLQHVELLRCCTAETMARERLASASRELEAQWTTLHRLRYRIALAITAVFTGSLTCSLLLAGNAVASGGLTVGGFVLANVYMLQLVRPLELMGTAARDIAQSLGFVRPLIALLRELPEPATPAAGDGADVPSPQTRGASITFDKVSFSHDQRTPVLHQLSLHIPAGRTIAIVGPSGSGKSSLARLMLRLYEPQEGRILLDGQPITALSATALRRRIALVSQDTALLHDTLARNLGLGLPRLDVTALTRAAAQAQLQTFIEGLPQGLDTLVGERGQKLSGGERQRLAVARALLREATVYVFDESTSMLDARTEAALLQQLRQATAGCTVVLIAHRLSTVRQADEIVVLHDGRIAEQGSHEELLCQGGPYAQMWRHQDGGNAAVRG